MKIPTGILRPIQAAIFMAVCMAACMPPTATIAAQEKSRLIVSTDLGGSDPDDTQSMIHLLLCSDRIDLEGIISAQAWLDDPDRTAKVRAVIDNYREVYPNLINHSKGFPSPSRLDSITARGQEKAHMAGVGEGKDSPGSELIISVVDDNSDPRPVWIAAWGGINTLAQALWKVSHTRSPEETGKFIKKLRVYDILGQDDAGAWIAATFPGLLYIRNEKVYGWAPGDEWTRENIRTVMPFGQHYPERIWATEGDSPSFLYLIANGLNSPENIGYGGWGGRFSTEKKSNVRGMDFIEKSGKDESAFGDYLMYVSAAEGVSAINIWKEHIYNDFAARMIWTVTPDFTKANHHPTVIVDNDGSLLPMTVSAAPGDTLCLDASRSHDADNDSISFVWKIYEEAGDMRGAAIGNPTGEKCTVSIPKSESGKSLHVILEVSDNGSPSLTSYKRIVILTNQDDKQQL